MQMKIIATIQTLNTTKCVRCHTQFEANEKFCKKLSIISQWKIYLPNEFHQKERENEKNMDLCIKLTPNDYQTKHIEN